ncbi:hypothetical protein [Luteolibacter marinus]|uniref:hypothetical protein n=1 Tax=Luteolibacter marinus TaxID=2776705 RepID=UPI001868D2C8|nr:hypothetical protein [Luteolibacter marinus]
MQTHRIVATVASLMCLAAAQADVYMGLGADQLHYQESALKVRFDSGELNLILRDGLVVLAPCSVDPQLFFFTPSIPCPLGATGFIAQGDVDRDGVRDDNQYWSVATVVPALLIEPSRQDLVQLFAAPPSKLPRPLQNFRDDSLVAFYDISTPTVRHFDQSRYEFVRRYGSVRQVETTIARGLVGPAGAGAGTIILTVTGADIPNSPVVVEIDAEIQTAAEWANTARLALGANADITSVYSVGGTGANIVLTELVADGNDPTLNIAIEAGTATLAELPIPTSLNTLAGTYVGTPAAALKQMGEELVPGQYTFTFPRLGSPDLNPVAIPVTVVPYVEAYGAGRQARKGFRFTQASWDGDYYQMDPRVITSIDWQGNDRSVIRPGDEIYFSILNEAEDFLLFPPTVPQNPVLLSTPTVTSYTMPPFFFTVGDEGVINLRFQRNLPSNGVAYDVSQRVFRARTRMVDSYYGYAPVTLPIGTSKRDLDPKSNIDGDSMTNIEEFAYQFPTNEDINASAKEQYDPGVSDTFDFVEQFSRVVTKFPDPINDPLVQPDGPAAPYLDADNHIVFEVPYRPRIGTSLKYQFVEYITNKRGKKRAKKLKNITKDWTLELSDPVEETVNVLIEIKVIDTATGDVTAIQSGGNMDVTLGRQYLVLRSLEPVADPLAPLPELGVIPTAVKIN